MLETTDGCQFLALLHVLVPQLGVGSLVGLGLLEGNAGDIDTGQLLGSLKADGLKHVLVSLLLELVRTHSLAILSVLRGDTGLSRHGQQHCC